MTRVIPERRLDATRVASAVALALPVVVVAFMGYSERWVTEDAFIDLRVVQQILAGHGPVFNIGERVEAYTSPLWVALLAGWGAMGGPLEAGSVALGLLFCVLGVLLAQVAACRLASRLRAADGDAAVGAGGLLVPLGTAVFVAVPVAWDFVTSGLESGLVIGWLGGTFWLLTRASPQGRWDLRVAALVIGCGPLVRPDLALFSAGFAVVLVVLGAAGAERRLTAREWLGLAVIAAALPAGYQVFRMGYFAALVPNTALAKEASAAYWSQGWRYTRDFFGTYVLWLPLPIAAGWAAVLLRRAGRAGDRVATALVLAPMLSAAAHWLYVTRVGGDFMHGRVLLPTLFGFLLPVATVIVPAPAYRGWRMLSLAGVAGWAIVCAVWLRVPYAGQGAPGPWGIADEHGYYEYHLQTRRPVTVASYARHPALMKFAQGLPAFHRAVVVNEEAGLRALAPLSPSVPPTIRFVLGLSNIGILGYLAGPDIHVVDQLGLADPIAGRMLLTTRGRPGHEKYLRPEWIAGRFGDHVTAPPLPPAAVDAAQAVECGDLARLLRAVDAPLTLSRFLDNVRGAWSLSRLRIPADPAAARERFCAPAATRS